MKMENNLKENMAQKNSKKNTGTKKQKKTSVAQGKMVHTIYETTFANRQAYAQIILPQFVF